MPDDSGSRPAPVPGAPASSTPASLHGPTRTAGTSGRIEGIADSTPPGPPRRRIRSRNAARPAGVAHEEDAAAAGAVAPALSAIVGRFPPETFDRGEVLIENTFLQTGIDGGAPMLAYVHEGLVRGAWRRSKVAPKSRATAIVAGDGRWIGADAFKYGENLFRYLALTPTVASLVPMTYLRDRAPRAVLIDALQSVSLDWCTTASVLSLGGHTLRRRALLLLYDMSRLHPRPEIEVRQRDVADLLGVARQTMQPVLARLAAEGLISLGYSEIVVSDSDRLFEELRRTG